MAAGDKMKNNQLRDDDDDEHGEAVGVEEVLEASTQQQQNRPNQEELKTLQYLIENLWLEMGDYRAQKNEIQNFSMNEWRERTNLSMK